MKATLIVLSFTLWSCPIFGLESQIPGISYLVFSPETANIKDAQLRQPPVKVNKTDFKNEYFQIEYSENTRKVFLLKHSDKKYYKFLLEPFEIRSQQFNSDIVKPLVTPLGDRK